MTSLVSEFPARIVGGYRSGKTTALRELADALAQPLVICATESGAAAFGHGATTFWRLAADVLARHRDAVRILSSEEQRARFEDAELADTVCHYQASFLGREELRTHADAAGVFDQWEAMASRADAYQDDLAQRGEADWAGVLVQASLLLRDEAVLAAERARFSHVLVDDFEAASFAANRLLSQLSGFGGPVVVTGNPENDVWRHVAGSPRYLEQFPRRFGARREVALDAVHGRGAVGGGKAVLVLQPGGDAWLPNPDGPLPVALATSLSWASVTIVESAQPRSSEDHTTYDLHVLGGPDVPDAAERAARRRRQDEARRRLAETR